MDSDTLDSRFSRVAILACLCGVTWGGVVGGIAGARGDFDDSLTLISGACALAVATLCTILGSEGGVLVRLGRFVIRLAAAIFAVLVILGFMLLLTLPLQFLDRFSFMQAYRRRFPDASGYMFEQVITLVGLGVVAFLARRRLGSMMLVGVYAALSFGFPLIAGLSALAFTSLPAIAVVAIWVQIAGHWSAGTTGLVAGAILGGVTGILHGFAVAFISLVVAPAISEQFS